MKRDDIFNAVIRRDAVLTKYILKIERDTVDKLMWEADEADEEVAGLKEKLKTTTEQLRAERQKVRRSGTYVQAPTIDRLYRRDY